MGEGRDGARQAEELARTLTSATSTAEAESAFRALLNGDRDTYLVASVLRGAKRISGASSFGCVAVENGCWPAPGKELVEQQRVDGRLARFLTRHTDGVRACGFVVEVSAWDPAHAWTLASQAAAELRDQVSAEHRVGHFSLAAEVAVLDVARERVTTQRPLKVSVASARTLTTSSSPALREALRFHALSQEERVPVVSVLHCWIALEHLAHNAQTRLADGGLKTRERASSCRCTWPRSWPWPLPAPC